MTYLYDNYLGEKVYSVTFDHNLYNQMFFESGSESEYTENINVGDSGTGYYIDGYNENSGKCSVSTYVPDVRTVYFTNTNNWSDVRAYLWKSGTMQNNIWHGAKMKYINSNEKGEDIYAITFDYKEYDCVVFNDYNSTSQTTDIRIGDNNSLYYLNGKKVGNKWTVGSYIYT